MLVGGTKCCFAGGEHGPCQGRLEWHHAIKQQRLKRQFPFGAYRSSPEYPWAPLTRHGAPDGWEYWPDSDSIGLNAILGDTRNRVWLCDTHHERLHNGRFYIDELPESVWEFAREFGLDGQLENDLARRAA